MTAKEHYDNHLANFYSWMIDDFDKAKNAFKDFCKNQNIKPNANKLAIDLGAGNGIQSIALAELGYKVKAVDFNHKLLSELKSRINDKPIEVVYNDIINIKSIAEQPVELIVCCGDTISHLDSFENLYKLLYDCFDTLYMQGILVLTFRDYTYELKDTQRFIPVKSDEKRILTCILDYFNDKIRVTDLLHEKENGKWVQKLSSYDKLRVTTDSIIKKSHEIGFTLLENISINRMEHLILRK